VSELKKKSILLVEDDGLIALATRRILESAGYEVTVSHTGEKALEMVSGSFVPDLILMDIDLGQGMDGTETAQRILGQHVLPVVFLSSHAEPEIVARTETITSYGYIQKGLPDTILLTSIRVAFHLWDAHRRVVESESLQTNLFEQVPGAIYQFQYFPDGTSRFPMASGNIWLVYEVTPEEVVDDAGPAFRRIHPADFDLVVSSIVRSRDTMEDWELDYRVLLPSRGERWLRGRARPEQLDDGSVLWHGYISDVTERKLAELQSAVQHEIIQTIDDGVIAADHTGVTTSNTPAAAAHYLEAELYALIQRDPEIFTFLREGSLDGIWYWDLEKPDHEWMDNRFWKLLGYHPETKQHDPSEWQNLIHPDDLKIALKNFHAHLEDPKHPYDQVVRYTHREGKTVYVRCRGLAIRDEDGKPLRMLGVHNDITELMTTISTEKMLRHELNHRVKNNLAIVKSLISLKQYDNHGATDLSDILHQVDTIRLLHEQLQSSEELTSLELKPYLKSIIASVVDSSVRVEISGPDVEVSSKTAVPLGLVVNELATNAVKHGFSGDTEKRFTVKIVEVGNTSDRVGIVVSNTGLPFPAHLDVNNAPSLGLRLVTSLVEQLESHLVLEREPHPVFQFDVPCKAVGT